MAFAEYAVNGACSLAVRDYGGSGAPILLMHGAGRNLADMAPIANRLAARHRVVAMDLRNHGRSDDAPWDWDALLDDVDRVAAAARLRSPAVVGHSLGGMISALYDARGGQCSSVVNIDGYGLGTVDQYLGVPADEVLEFHRTVLRAAEAGRTGPLDEATVPAARAAAVRIAAVRTAPGANLPEELEIATFDRALRPLPDDTFVVRPNGTAVDAMSHGIMAIDWFAVFRQVTAPFLIYRCTARTPTGWDTPIPDLDRMMAAADRGRRRDLDRLVAERPNVRFRTLDADHMAILTIPDTIASQIHDFVTEAC